MIVTLENSLRTYLLKSPKVTAVIGERLFAVEASEKRQYPLGVFQLVSSPREYSFAGDSNMITARVQIDVWSKQHHEVVGGIRAIVERISGFTGDMEGLPVDSIMMGGNESDLPYNDELKIYGRFTDAIITYHQPDDGG